MTEFSNELSFDLAKTVASNPAVDAARAAEFLDYVKRLQANGFDLTPRYEISRPFSKHPTENGQAPTLSRNASNRRRYE